MCHPACKNGAFKAGNIGVRIKVVAAHIGKINHVGIGNGMLGCNECFTNFKIFKILTKRMNVLFNLFGALLVLV